MSHTINSDSEDDLDYVPPEDDHDSDEQDQVENLAATSSHTTNPAEQKKERDALWASFQASVSTFPLSNNRPVQTPRASQVKRVKIEKTYLFAGKHVRDVVEVPEDSEEAKKWPHWNPETSTSTPSAEKEEDKNEYHTLPPPADSSLGTATPARSTPGVKRPGARKSRIVLPSIPKTSQAKKITTLDKSAMDWRAHVASQSSDLKDELDANKRGGGYLEKVEFLKRVEDRREDVYEASKLNKRRKT